MKKYIEVYSIKEAGMLLQRCELYYSYVGGNVERYRSDGDVLLNYYKYYKLNPNYSDTKSILVDSISMAHILFSDDELYYYKDVQSSLYSYNRKLVKCSKREQIATVDVYKLVDND